MKNIALLIIAIGILSCQSKKEPKNEVSLNKNLQEKIFPKLDKDRYNVAFLIMDGTYNTELTAPFDIFQHTIFRKV